MKPVWCRHRGNVVLGLLVGLLLLTALSSCRKSAENSTASPTPAASQPVDRTESGTAAGQITADPASSLAGRAVQKAVGMKCLENLRQVRMLVETYKADHEGNYPATLSEMPEAARIGSCPLGHEPYAIDAATGKVSCPHAGHETF